MIEIGGQTFASVADVREYVSNVLNNAPFDEPLSETDEKLIHELFLHHPEAMEKIGGESVEYFKVGKHPQAGARAFCIVRSDGVEETFSMKKCVAGWARKVTADVSKAKPAAKKKPAPQQKLLDVGERVNVEQDSYSVGISGLLERFQRVMALHAELGKEIEQIQKLLADESKR